MEEWIIGQEEVATWTLQGVFEADGSLSYLLMETTGYLLLENVDKIILE